jgi:hypothetical protein
MEMSRIAGRESTSEDVKDPQREKGLVFLIHKAHGGSQGLA